MHEHVWCVCVCFAEELLCANPWRSRSRAVQSRKHGRNQPRLCTSADAHSRVIVSCARMQSARVVNNWFVLEILKTPLEQLPSVAPFLPTLRRHPVRRSNCRSPLPYAINWKSPDHVRMKNAHVHNHSVGKCWLHRSEIVRVRACIGSRAITSVCAGY